MLIRRWINFGIPSRLAVGHLTGIANPNIQSATQFCMKSEICLCIEVLKIKRNWDATPFTRREWKERLRNLINWTDTAEIQLNPAPIDYPPRYEEEYNLTK